uniref:Lipocalin domain-containing protein n=1 Tax=Plectus sambesii TaxID=2011161 RepID=A0A914VQC4_9BILA
NGKDSTFSIFDSFREGGEQGPPKIGFGYGLKNGQKVNVYTQQDPCPYQVVLVGPKSSQGQYEYVIMSNWAKYPVIGMVRDLDLYASKYRKEMEQELRKEGYLNILTNMLGGSLRFVDWRTCRNSQVTTGNIVGNILNGLLFG